MSQPNLLKRIIDALDAAGIDYMITGSVASSLQGEPRLTHDLDLVAAIDTHQVDTLAKALSGTELYLDVEAARDAVRTGGMFNVIDMVEGDKVDFWMLTKEPFDRSRWHCWSHLAVGSRTQERRGDLTPISASLVYNDCI